MRRITATLAAIGILVFGCVSYYAGAHHAFAPSQLAAADDCQSFPQMGFQVCGDFLAYWKANGGLAQQGYPISPTFQEKSETDGKTYTVQYFERAVFEAHPENQPPYNVLLSLLGSQKYKAKYPNGVPSNNSQATTSPADALPTVTPLPPAPSAIPMVFYGVTWNVTRGNLASASVQTVPNASCSITVTYKGVVAKDPNLAPKIADAGGNIKWTWVIGADVPVGIWPIDATCSLNGGPVAKAHENITVA